MKQKLAIITGNGQDSAYLTQLLLEKDYKVILVTRRSGSNNNWRLKELNLLGNKNLHFRFCDLTETLGIYSLIKEYQPDEFYNLAAQSFVQSSFTQPYTTVNSNFVGVLNILEGIRQFSPHTRFYQASTSEMFGKVQESPQKETTPFYPRSPYGIAKLAAHWLTINYRESYNLFACCGILFNHESPLRGEEFVTRKITMEVTRIHNEIKRKSGIVKPLVLGNLFAQRDWGHAKDYVNGMWLMLQQDEPHEYVLATGMTYTIKDFVNTAFENIGVKLFWHDNDEKTYAEDKEDRILVKVSKEFYRSAEVDLLLGNPSKAEKELGWQREYNFYSLVDEMVNKDFERFNK